MRSGPAAGYRGHFHEAGFYGSDEEFVALVTPFFTEGLDAGEPVVSIFEPCRQALLRDVFGPDDGVRFIDGGEHYSKPATVVGRHREMLAEYVREGAAQIRIAGDVPHPGVGVPWDWWARYEAIANHAYDDFPMYGLCPYDSRTSPAHVVDEVLRTHPHVATATGHRASGRYEEPADFVRDRASAWQDPLEHTPARFAFTDPAPVAVRAAIEAAGHGTEVSPADLDGLALAATEAVTNAMIHGAAPVDVRLWAAERRMVVTVTDRGRGPQDPLVGLRPTGATLGGLGLWIAHQVCAHVALEFAGAAFTVRLVAGEPVP
ncbi:sensor histidine kinase [Dactylosporangium sp. AC04546]|uniref:sensor histidine kinase n=1 Tax=Dactylosporangium sp. AC04546 TaxID=2862460 RepID=UPI001EDD6A99|nr:sensor histidine kinase [Dactylosporangium sp. AC04546]WVK88129.1 sensor histidine kinase [Dactylosporangium sp. AC04546]